MRRPRRENDPVRLAPKPTEREPERGTGTGVKRIGLREEASAVIAPGQARRIGRELVEAFAEKDLLTYASAIGFRVLFALIPLARFGLALLGFLDLSEVWSRDLAPSVKEETSNAAFTVIDRTVTTVLTSKRALWLTVGLALALWTVSGAMRAVMGALNTVYEVEDERSLWRRLITSFWLALAVAACLLGATFLVAIGKRLALDVGGAAAVGLAVLRWSAAAALMVLAIGLLIRVTPASHQPVRWVSVGSALVVVFWIAASLLFGWYASSLATYTSIYANLASVIVLLTYLYVSSIAFLAGVQLDALLRKSVAGTARPQS